MRVSQRDQCEGGEEVNPRPETLTLTPTLTLTQRDQCEGAEEAEEEGDVGADPRERVLVPDQLHRARRRLAWVRVTVAG